MNPIASAQRHLGAGESAIHVERKGQHPLAKFDE